MLLKPVLLASLCFASAVASAAGLTPLETRWLTAASPVLAYAQRLGLPIDIIVQPQAKSGDVPLAMGFEDRRCKLVLSLRGNPQAEAQLTGVAQELQGELIEAMAAHEVGHCWRYARGVWHALPSGFVEVDEERAPDAALLAESKAMRATRREEGYADLVALAWTQWRHPADYGRVYGWLEALRRDVPVAHGGHDTRAWVRLARDGARFGRAAAPFEDVAPLWREGLLSED